MAIEPQTTTHLPIHPFTHLPIYSFTHLLIIMQNEPKFKKARMNASTVLTKDYDNWTLGERGKNKPNTNPIQTQTKPNAKKPK